MKQHFQLIVFSASILISTSVFAEDTAFHIFVDEKNNIVFSPIESVSLSKHLTKTGLLVWGENEQDRWQLLPSDYIESLPDKSSTLVNLTRNSRQSNSVFMPPATLPPTTQLTQLVGQMVMRGNSFITPVENGLVIDGRITIRRRPNSRAGTPYPEVQIEIIRDGLPFLKLSLDDGEHTLRWSNIDGLPETLTNGLSPGSYTIRAIDGSYSSNFRVATKQYRDKVMKIPDEILRISQVNDDPIWLQVAVETLLSNQDATSLNPLYSDALDLLDRGDGLALKSTHLRTVYDELKNRLFGDDPQERSKTARVTDLVESATGIESIDHVRKLIQTSDWNAAAKAIERIRLESDDRTLALASLYQAVLLAESTQTTGDAASQLFQDSIDRLKNGNPSDRIRASNNYALFLFGRSQDRIYNHAFQMASGVRNPLIASFRDWMEARAYLESALDLAEAHMPSEVSSIQVNLARLYCTLADLLLVIKPADPNESHEKIVNKAQELSKKMASEAVQADNASLHVIAVSEEIISHLAFRQGKLDQCLDHADKALLAYLDEGSLSGCESIYRLRGLLRRSLEGKKIDDSGSNQSFEIALNDLMKSHLLAEVLRQRMPADDTGSTVAGFFARRAYVNEEIVTLMVDLGRAADALKFAELAKARSLQDILTTSDVSGLAETDLSPTANWPDGIVAMEYFIGSEKAWLFVVTPDAKVTSFLIRDELGIPIHSRELIARTHRLINSFDRLGPVQGRRIAQAAGSGKATYDQEWQHELHWFYNVLIPTECRSLLESADTVVIVPHHLLHYFPFSAMVTKIDESANSPTKMPLPRFFVEEPFCLVNAPSIATWRLLREKHNRPLKQVNIIGISDFGGRASALPGVKAEIANLKGIFRQSISNLVSDNDASESRIRALLGQQGILTLSTHGQKVPDKPLDAFLVCQPDEHNDGYLRASEIYSLKVEADLVLLNACYGGFADRSPMQGDDLFGVQRALLQSGARTVVSGIWDIYDATAPDIMNDFWKNISQEISAPHALADAQRNYLKIWREFPQEPLRFLTHPYYWAVFTVAGDDRTGSHVSFSKSLP